VVAAAVPLTLAAVFIVMLATGRDFDRITLGALILSLGLLVDDAIIAIEMMVVKMEEGVDRLAAATEAWHATAAPMLTGHARDDHRLPAGRLRRSSAGEYAGNIFWIVAFALSPPGSWRCCSRLHGRKLLPAIAPKARRARGDLPHARLRPPCGQSSPGAWITSAKVALATSAPSCSQPSG
jgi:hypothetical protein